MAPPSENTATVVYSHCTNRFEHHTVAVFSLNPIELAYDTRRPDGRLIATSAFNQLCHYASRPDTGPVLRRTRHFFPSGGLGRQCSLCLPTNGGMARLSRPWWLWLNTVFDPVTCTPFDVILTGGRGIVMDYCCALQWLSRLGSVVNAMLVKRIAACTHLSSTIYEL